MSNDGNYYIVNIQGEYVLGYGLSTNGNYNKFILYDIKNATSFDTDVSVSKAYPIKLINNNDALRIINGKTTFSKVLHSHPSHKRSRSASRSRSPSSRFKGGRRKNGTKRVYRKAKQ
jgi:hypothetical protein